MARRRSLEEAAAARQSNFWKGILFIPALLALMVGSAGVAVFPDIAQLAAPVVCSGGHLVTTTSSYSDGHGRGGTQTSASCVDARGARSNAPAVLIMLVIMGELFVPFAGIGWWVCSQAWPMPKPEDDD